MADIVIIGGSIMGSSIAYHLAVAGKAGDVCVIEPDPTYEFAAAQRSSGGVRLMHGLAENIEMSVYGQDFYRDFANRGEVDGEPGRFDFLEFGYLHLLAGADDVGVAEQNCALQNSHGASNQMIDRDELKRRFPSMRTDDIDAALHGPQDGFVDPYAAVIGFRRKARSLGVEFVQDRAVGFETDATKVQRVVLGGALLGSCFVSASQRIIPPPNSTRRSAHLADQAGDAVHGGDLDAARPGRAHQRVELAGGGRLGHAHAAVGAARRVRQAQAGRVHPRRAAELRARVVGGGAALAPQRGLLPAPLARRAGGLAAAARHDGHHRPRVAGRVVGAAAVRRGPAPSLNL